MRVYEDEVAVAPDSGLEDTCHVLKGTETSEIFTAVLGLVDITRGTNSHHKLQLLQSDNGRQYRKIDAIKAFHALFLDKTGNEWSERGNFQKLPNKHYPLEIDYD
ncbi:unnamed protein product [Rotaria sordida]|uniref:NAD(+) ADP-ribosyltransferase n=1 Tax=Rotaria sordida TaxID=392033 RepID=A0A815CSA3_9BILA|nr:unnamed protein product [Rotaria sordida]CAF3996305.1 unnamed protein product [Rotaria sordida]